VANGQSAVFYRGYFYERSRRFQKIARFIAGKSPVALFPFWWVGDCLANALPGSEHVSVAVRDSKSSVGIFTALKRAKHRFCLAPSYFH